ncbi:restriction endonuclease subunit S [Citrobacter koseri]|uniref:restriction endonuclease subunit S n=1 Tax=Citrobacter TaxID=544 RepID=UPI000CE670ED|nr:MULTISPECIES: restriction endonuclease subunit S [Citrobacter]AVE57058.1 restriction endonuclease subunit S [Citrobacter koseri]MDM2988210.1 restriction endonuclease subunit S [Citrobacter sp. CK196]
MTEQQLPEGWQMVKFGDIAKHISKRVEPSETDLEIYVGLEHLDPDSLKIKRYGTPSDVEGQKLLVKKGQIIFGKRRAYQRKVAVADWDCICSAHAMVLEANSKAIIPEFLPFFIQSDEFMSRAIAISEGSLSPTIKWKVLEKQLFPLPPLQQQVALVELLLATDKIIDSSFAAEQSAKFLLSNFILHVPNGNVYKLSELGTWKGGGTPSKQNNNFWGNGTINWISPKDMFSGIICNSEDLITTEAIQKSSTNLIKKESILLVTRSGILRHSLPIGILEKDSAINQDIKALTVNKKIVRPFYLWAMLVARSNTILKNCMKVGTTVESIDFTSLKNFEINIHPYEEQETIESITKVLLECITLIQQKVVEANSLKKSLLSRGF